MDDVAGRVVSAKFAALGAAGALFMASFGVMLAVLPLQIRETFGGTNAEVGFAYGSFAVGALVARPVMGRIGDRFGRGVLVAWAGVGGAVAYAAMAFAPNIAWLVVARAAWGVAFGAHMVGTMSLALDLSPPGQRGKAAAYLLTANHIGMGLGPFAGAAMWGAWSFGAVCVVCAVATLATAVVGLAFRVPHASRSRSPVAQPSRWFHPAGVAPGLFQAIGGLPFIAFGSFAALFVKQTGMGPAAPVLFAASCTVVVVRIVGGGLPDRLIGVRGAALSLALVGTGSVAMGVWRQPIGLYASVVVLASGHALLLPTLVGTMSPHVGVHERSSALATFTASQDVSTAIGPLLLGFVAELGGHAAAFIAAGVLALAMIPMAGAMDSARLGRRVAATRALPREGSASSHEDQTTGQGEGDAGHRVRVRRR